MQQLCSGRGRGSGPGKRLCVDGGKFRQKGAQSAAQHELRASYCAATREKQCGGS